MCIDKLIKSQMFQNFPVLSPKEKAIIAPSALVPHLRWQPQIHVS